MDNKELNKLLREKEKRIKLDNYDHDFASFAEEQIKIITKDASQGFVPFKLNECQKRITDALSTQLKETGKVRAIILKARQQGISTYCAGRVFWKSYFTGYARSVVMAHDSATSDALFAMSKNLIQNMEGELNLMNSDQTQKKSLSKAQQWRRMLKRLIDYTLLVLRKLEEGLRLLLLICQKLLSWGYDSKILAGLFQGISSAAGTEVILESTANGAQGEFYRLWKGAVAGKTNIYLYSYLGILHLNTEEKLPRECKQL